MKNMKKFISSAIILSLVLTNILSMAAYAQTPADSLFILAADVLTDLKIISEEDISSKNVTRQEIALFIAKIRSAVPDYFTDDASAPRFYSDLTEENSKYLTAIQYCDENGIFERRFNDDTFKPKGTVTLKEAVKMLLTALGHTGLSDGAAVIFKASDKDIKLLGEYAEFTFTGVSPDKILTKNDVIMLLYNFFLCNYSYLDMIWDPVALMYTSAIRADPVYKKFLSPDKYKNLNDYLEKFIKTTVTSSVVTVNGVKVSLDAYNINGSNYFKLRDLAYVLNGTEKQFGIGWDEVKNAISLTGGEAYTPVGGEMTAKNAESKMSVPTKPTKAKIYLNGKEISLTAYNISGNNYFRLRDIGQAFNFGVTFDETENTVAIDTTSGYTPE